MKRKEAKKPMGVEELAGKYKSGRVCLEYVLLHYLTHCRQEPLTVALIKSLQKAIECANLGQWETYIPLHGGTRSVRQIVEEYGLAAFVRPQTNLGETAHE